MNDPFRAEALAAVNMHRELILAINASGELDEDRRLVVIAEPWRLAGWGGGPIAPDGLAVVSMHEGALLALPTMASEPDLVAALIAAREEAGPRGFVVAYLALRSALIPYQFTPNHVTRARVAVRPTLPGIC